MNERGAYFDFTWLRYFMLLQSNKTESKRNRSNKKKKDLLLDNTDTKNTVLTDMHTVDNTPLNPRIFGKIFC